MNKRSLISFILLLAIPVTVGADMYRCELSDGSVIYGDKRVNLSDECQSVTEDSAKEYLSIQQPAPRSPAQDQPVATDLEAERATVTGATPDSWQARAITLVDDYNDALKRRRRESYLVDKRKAMKDMASVNAKKNAMLAELPDSPLSKQERDEIRGILAEIPEDAP